MSDEDVLEAGRAIRPYLAELVGPDADQVDAELAGLLNRGDAKSREVEGLIVDCLTRYQATQDWAAAFLANQRSHDLSADQHRYGPLGGDGEPVAAPRFACPEGEDTVWYQHSIGQRPPICGTHHIALQPAPGR